MEVDRAQLEEALAQAAAEAAGPNLGLFGPGSAVWHLAREGSVFLGAGRAILLQLAHPSVAYAIADHSQTETDPIGRFNRTFQGVYGMVFGDLEHALGAARRVHAVHSHVRGAVREPARGRPAGARYAANDPEALLWVLATLVDGSVQAHELLSGPLPPSFRAEYWRQTRQLARLFGIPSADLPEDWAGFQRYVARTVAELEPTAPALRIADLLLRPPLRGRRALYAWYRAMTAQLLPPRLRRPYGLRFGRRERAAVAASLPALRTAYPRLPPRLRYVPAYVEARRRLAGRPARARMGRTLEWGLLRVLAPAGGS